MLATLQIAWKSLVRCTPCVFFGTALLLWVSSAGAEDGKDEGAVENGPWISSITWVDDSTLIGTHSQGLLLRPASVVKIMANDPSKLEAVGEAETSLWSVIPFGSGFLASDYKGGLAIYGGDAPRKLEIEARWIRSLKRAPSGELCLAGSEDGKLIAIKLKDGTETKRVEAGAAAIFDIAFNPAGDQVAVGCGDGSIKLFSWPAFEPAGEMSRGKEAIWSLVYSADGSQLISGGADRRLQLWDVASKRSQLTLTKTPDWVTSLVRIPESTLVAAGCLNGSVVVADYQALIPVAEVPWTNSGIWSLALSPNGQILAAGTRKSGVATRSIEDWRTTASEVVAAFAAEAPPMP